ncbi:MAG: 50S ribosomal protein L9 [Candidatus Cloacimonetes bacterium ADurb.Bin117]|nr:MAG: 50S ribosomal protein L9 [Candidatus Cloacimonetes bacterium ADurb.Bin117]
MDEHDSMFGSVSEIDIVNELAAQDVNIHKSAVLMEKNIKSLGETVVQIRLHKDIVSELKVLVEKETRDEVVEEQVATPAEPEIPTEPEAVAEVVETEEPKPTEDEI